MHVCVCECMHVHACMCVCVCVCVYACMHVCVCSQACCSHATALIFSFMDSLVFKQQVLFRVHFLSVSLDHRVQCPRVGLGVKI